MGERTTLVDNNTNNMTHIGRVGMIMGSREAEAHDLAVELDVDYVVVVFGGYGLHKGDDIGKFLWMVRIAGYTNPHIKESDYRNNNKVYRVDGLGSKTMLNSLMYKLCYYRFNEAKTPKGYGFDRVR